MQRLLERISDTKLGSVSDRHFRNVLFIEKDFARRWLLDTHNHLGKRRFTGTVRASDDHKFTSFNFERQIVNNGSLFGAIFNHKNYILQVEHQDNNSIKMELFFSGDGERSDG